MERRFVDSFSGRYGIVKARKPHFFGSIILKKGSAPAPGDSFSQRWTLVDGQQRLTTFLIFMKVLCLKHGQTALFDYQFRIMGKMIALRHGRNDIKAFEQVMAAEKAEKLDNPSPYSRIIEAFNFFVDNIVASKLDIMAINTNTQFVRIDLLADEDEQQIFDTINSLGVNLTTSELLKNYFFNRENVSEYEFRWVEVFEKDDETKMYWDTVIETGRIRRAMIDIFFDAFFQIFVQDKKYSITNEDKVMYARVDNLAQSYQHFINIYCGGNKDAVLQPMKDYAKCFMQNFRPEHCKMSVPGSFGIERMNVIIFGLKNTTLIPYILYLSKNVYDADELNKMLGILESYIMRRLVVHADTKNYNNLFTSLILNSALDSSQLLARLKSSNDATTYMPDDTDLLQGFNSSKLVNLQSKGILYLMESKIRPSSIATALLGFDQYSLEHIMPKKWRNNWPACENEEAARRRDSVLLTLGNLAIITQSLNASIRDASWENKKDGREISKSGKTTMKPGLVTCAGGLLTLQKVLASDTWDDERIAERACWLFEQAKTIWQI